MSDDSSKLVEPKPAEQVGVAPFPRGRWDAAFAVLYSIGTYWAVSQFIAPLLLYVAILPFVSGSSKRLIDILTNSVVAQFFFVVVAEALMFGAIVYALRLRHASLRTIAWRRPRFVDPLLGLGGIAVYYILFLVVLGVATQLLPGINTSQKQELGFDHVAGPFNLLLTFLSLVVLPPLVEETVFRGFLFTGLRQKFKPVGAALITSALFATAHLEFGSGKPLLWVAALDTFTLSLVLCFLRQKTDSLWPGIFVHALKNGVAFVTLYLIHP